MIKKYEDEFKINQILNNKIKKKPTTNQCKKKGQTKHESQVS